jgi:hypothetical protein
VISKPLEIKIFEKEINTVLLKEKNAMALNNKRKSQIILNPTSRRTKPKLIVSSQKSHARKKKSIRFTKPTSPKPKAPKSTMKLGKGRF